MKLKMLAACAVLALAAIAPPAAIAAPASEAQIAIEDTPHAAPAERSSAQQYAREIEIRCVVRVAGDYFDVMPPATLAIACEGTSLLVVAAAVGRVDRDPITHPLLL